MILFRSLCFALFQAVSLTVWGTLFLLLAPFLSPSWRYAFAMRWPAMMVWAARFILGIRWRVLHAERLEPFRDRAIIVASKHQSAWETFFLPTYLPRQLCFVFKKELLRIPFFGWGIGLLPMIHIDRKQARKAYQQIAEQGQRRAQERRWITFFPEGTRTAPGQRIPYKGGAARLAFTLGLPVVPIAHNAGYLWPRKAFLKKSGVVTVVIGEALEPSQFSSDELLLRAIEQWIEKTCAEMEAHGSTGATLPL